MMERENYSQLELFSSVNTDNALQRRASKSLLSRIRGYEKTILAVICLVITAVISFSLGVEKGKHIAALKTLRPELANKIKALPALTKQATVQQNNAEGIRAQSGEEKTIPMQNYTIQLASYRSKQDADKEAVLLKKKGLAPLILPKGKFVIICVGNFSNKQTAQSLLLVLKKRYQDCFIRRL